MWLFALKWSSALYVFVILHTQWSNTNALFNSVGSTLMDALDTLISDQRIQPQLAMRILANYDRVVAETLKEKVKGKLTFKGHLHTYRFCDDVWTFVVKDVNLKMDNGDTINADKVKIVACNSKRAGET